MKQRIIKVVILVVLISTAMGGVPFVAQASPLTTFLQGAAAYAYVESVIRDMDDHKQVERLEETKKETGYLENRAYQNRAKRILESLESTELVKRHYVVYVTPSEEYNAFMTLGGVMAINKGTMDMLDDDELAYVMGHELSHGEHRDVLNGMKKSIGLSTALSMAVNDAGAVAVIMSNVANNYIRNEMFTMSQEKAADNMGYHIYTAAGYNPGAASSAMEVMYHKYGDLYREGLVKVAMPNNHPKTTSRIQDNIDRMKRYSNNHVDVKDGTVFVNGAPIYKPEAMGRYTSNMRAYLMAGKIAKIYHEKKVFQLRHVGSAVMLNGISIITAPNSKVAEEIYNKLTIAMAQTSD